MAEKKADMAIFTVHTNEAHVTDLSSLTYADFSARCDADLRDVLRFKIQNNQ